MSALDGQPDTLNFLSPVNFAFQIKRCPAVNFYVQKVNIPGISLPSPNYDNPYTPIPKAGDIIRFDELRITFKVDEVLQNWFEIYNWIVALGFPEDHEQYKAIQDQARVSQLGIVSDVSVFVLDSAKNPKFECVLKDAFPVSLSEFVMNSDVNDVNFITCQATFKYVNFIMNTHV